MCGIFGYVGKKNNAPEIVLDGLKLLEYRGYDSWGVASKTSDGKFELEKYVGKIGDARLSSKNISNLAIGHTRWATHGGVTKQNAHPHLDCKRETAVVHNGIVENFEDLKNDLLKKGHKFSSETDTEVIPHLIEEFNKKEGFVSSVRDAFNKLKGLNAIVVSSAKSSEIVAAKNGSPLVIGISGKDLYIASDAVGILKHTNEIIFLEDNQMIVLGKDLKILALPSGKEQKPRVEKLSWKFEDTEKGKHQHFFIKEANEQPAILKNIALNFDDQTKKLAELIEDAFGTFMLACGSAANSALFGTYIFSTVAKKHINFSIGSEFKYLEDYVTSKTLVIPISQSGESIDVIEPVMKVKEKGSEIASIVNTLGSTLYRISDNKTLLHAGPEKCVVATKSMTAMVATLLLTSYTLAGRQRDGKKLLLDAAGDVGKILKSDYIEKVKNIVRKLKDKNHMYILGRGLSYATALEMALKIKETTYTHAEGFAGGELKHGVIALIDRGTPCIIVAPKDETYDDIISNAQEVKARGSYVIGVGPKNNDVFDDFLPTADNKEATTISQIVVSQLLAYYLALEKGINDPDKPRNLAKSVTVK